MRSERCEWVGELSEMDKARQEESKYQFCVQSLSYTSTHKHLHCSTNAAVGDEATSCLPTKFMMFTNVEARLGSSSTPMGIVSETTWTEKDSVPSKASASRYVGMLISATRLFSNRKK